MGTSPLDSKCAYCGKRLKGRPITSPRLPDETPGAAYVARRVLGRVPVCPRCGRTQPWAASLDQPASAPPGAVGALPADASDNSGRHQIPAIPIIALMASAYSFLIAIFLLLNRLGLPSTMWGNRSWATMAGIVGLGLGLLTIWVFRPSRAWVTVGVVASVLGALGIAGTMGL
jgi:hypothetical protein